MTWTAKPGDIRYKDLNGDEKITDADRTYLGKMCIRDRAHAVQPLYNCSEYVIRPDINEQNRREMAEHNQ